VPPGHPDAQPGQHGDCPQFILLKEPIRIARRGKGRPRTQPGRAIADKAYSSATSRACLRGRGIKAVIPVKEDQKNGQGSGGHGARGARLGRRWHADHRRARGRSGGRPPSTPDATRSATPSSAASASSSSSAEVPRQFRAVATRSDKRELIFPGTDDVASIRIWLAIPFRNTSAGPGLRIVVTYFAGRLIEETLMTHPEGEQERWIVVGVDGSVPSKAALAWAVRQAKLNGAAVKAVIAWEYPATYGYPLPRSNVDHQYLAARAVAESIAEVSGPAEPVKISSEVAEGNAARVLVDASAGAELLVVGSRGHGGFVEALLGSVGQHCVQHATCPVVVIRDSVKGGP